LESDNLRQRFIASTSISTTLLSALNLCLVVTALLALLACFDRITEDTLAGHCAASSQQAASCSRPTLTQVVHGDATQHDSCAVIGPMHHDFPSTRDSVDTKLMTASRFCSDAVVSTRFTETKV